MDLSRTNRIVNRRSFLKGVAAFGGAAFVSGCTRGSAGPADGGALGADRIGLQLYTVRDQMQNDFEGTIERVAQIGYTKVEFAGYYERSPEQVRELLERLSLKAPSTHVSLEAMRADLEGQLSTAQAVGHEFVTVPMLPGGFGGGISAQEWHGYAEEFNGFGAACAARGLRFAYHNHSFEFAEAGEGLTGLDVLLAETDPELVSFELDLMWTVFAGHDPVALFQQYPGRFTMWHVKDMKNIEATRAAAAEGAAGFGAIFQNIAAVGEGEIDFTPIFANAGRSGLRHFFVENDMPQDSMPDIQTSFTNLQARFDT
jgi:sugar phosphate isomerase/epimerase